MESIKIMGAGLSGLSAAINLAKKGYNVDIFEKRSDCGKRFLGDLQGLENWSSKTNVIEELKSMNIKINFNNTAFKELNVSNGFEARKINLNRPMFYVVRRGIFDKTIDQSLKNQALDLGVNIHFNTKKDEKDIDIISKGPDDKKFMGIAKGISFETSSDDIAFLLLNKEASANGGYSYLLITKGHGCICSVNIYSTGKVANKYFKKTYELITKHVDIEIKNQKNVGGTGWFNVKPNLMIKGKIYTGEAAGLQDCLWGFGMRYAIISGYLASLSITENKNYKRLIYKKIGDRLKTSVVNRYISNKHYKYLQKYIFNVVKSDVGNWMDILYTRFNPTLYSRFLFPYAKIMVEKRTKSYLKEKNSN